MAVKSNLSFTSRVKSKRAKSSWGPSPRHCAQVTKVHSKKCHSGGKPLQQRVQFDIPEI